MLDSPVGQRMDIQERHIDSLQNKPTLVAEHAKRRLPPDRADRLGMRNSVQIYLNMTHKDPKKREMFANKQFRQALSLGINRKEIIDLVYLGQSKPYQTGPRPGHPWYHEKLSTPVHVSTTPSRPMRFWIKLGYNQTRLRKSIRLRPDGQSACSSAIDVIPTLYPGRRRYAGADQAPLGRDRCGHQGQHAGACPVLHTR